MTAWPQLRYRRVGRPYLRRVPRRHTPAKPEGEDARDLLANGGLPRGDPTRPEPSLCAAVPVDGGLSKGHRNVAFCATAVSLA
jgi:hypothetical protein